MYYESHVTVEPLFGEDLEKLKSIAEVYKFRVADLLMQKRPEDSPERSKYDTFATGQHKNLRLIGVARDYIGNRYLLWDDQEGHGAYFVISVDDFYSSNWQEVSGKVLE